MRRASLSPSRNTPMGYYTSDMRKLLLAVLAAVVAGALWGRKNPSDCPYSQRFWVQAPHPLITRARLREALGPPPPPRRGAPGPQRGEPILEVGPGTGYYSLPVAEWLGPDGTLEIFDLQQEMLDHTSGGAPGAGLANVVATQGDARALPYGDGAFDGAFLVTVLGEVPDQEAALRELARVVRPGGRVVVGEVLGDPHWVSPAALVRRAEAAGLRLERRICSPLGYFGVLGGPTRP